MVVTLFVYTKYLSLSPWRRVREKMTFADVVRKYYNIIRNDLQEVGCGYMDWTGLAQHRDRWRTLVSAVMNLRVP